MGFARRAIPHPQGMSSVGLRDQPGKARYWESRLVWLGNDYSKIARHVALMEPVERWVTILGAGSRGHTGHLDLQPRGLLLVSYVTEGHCNQHVVTMLATQASQRGKEHDPECSQLGELDLGDFEESTSRMGLGKRWDAEGWWVGWGGRGLPCLAHISQCLPLLSSFLCSPPLLPHLKSPPPQSVTPSLRLAVS
ncbi:hypothetical protein Cadr_000023150 [Camelus dromedarius]|uniref:Uncharacterized protein n=1 Tax=Camelus dromedarius TaxID=9838 RepID=A0A5N4CIC2_CAMDR|nr:hypothetical protein Cadr_000023150 [Camelus dromedarius]